MASSAPPGPAPTRTVTVPQIKAAEVPKKLQEGEEFIKWDEVSVRCAGLDLAVVVLCAV